MTRTRTTRLLEQWTMASVGKQFAVINSLGASRDYECGLSKGSVLSPVCWHGYSSLWSISWTMVWNGVKGS